MTRVFVASNMPTGYPYKLQKPSTANERVRPTADVFIFDSGIGDEVSNREVLDTAHAHDADYVIAKDYLHDHDRTTESVREFRRLYEKHPCDAIPMTPLQPPHAEHYRDLPDADHYVLGGMATDDVSFQEQRRWIRAFDEGVHDDAYVHALGVGGGSEFIREFAGTGILDSVDCSTPELAASFGAVLDADLRQQEVREYNGEGAAKRNVPLAAFNSWQIQDVWTREASDTGGTQLRMADL